MVGVRLANLVPLVRSIRILPRGTYEMNVSISGWNLSGWRSARVRTSPNGLHKVQQR